jgi:hypothetical protein
LVYCTKCGTQNEDDASHCIECGASLSEPAQTRRNWEDEIEFRAEEFGARAERFGRQMEEECFGLPYGSTIFGIMFGLAILIWGVSELVDLQIDIWPYLLVLFGLLIVAGAIYKQNRY